MRKEMVVTLGCYLKPTFQAVLLIVKNNTLPRSAVAVGCFPTLQFECVKEPGLLLEKTLGFFFLASMVPQVG